jgi:hypothetical protein
LNEDNSWLLLAVRNLGSCFASPILLLLHNDTTKYQTLISIIRQAPSQVISTECLDPEFCIWRHNLAATDLVTP